MKKILYVFDDINYPSGAQKAMLLQMGALKEEHQIYALSLSRPGPGIVPEGVGIVGETVWEKTGLLAKSFREVVRSKGIPTRKKAARAFFSVLVRLGKAEGYLERLLRKELKPRLETFDVVMVVSESSKARSLVAGLEKPKKIQWIHTDYKLWSGFSEWTRHVTKHDMEIYQGFDCIAVLSEHNRDGMLEVLPGLRDKMEVIPNLIDGERIQKKADGKLTMEIDDKKVNFLTVGRMDKEKGFDRILDICASLKGEKIPFCWYFVGDGPLEGHIKTRITKEGLEDYIILEGHQENPYPLMKQCDWFVLLSEYEGTPVTIDEAMVLGTPVAARDVGGVGEQLERAEGNVLIRNKAGAEEIRGLLFQKGKKTKTLNYEKWNALVLQKLKEIIE